MKLGDKHLPLFLLPDHAHLRPDFSVPDYERALSRGLREHVRSGDKVLIIGGGRGVTAAIAAKSTGETGSVVVFEGAQKWATRTRKTLLLNEVENRTEIHHAIVGEAVAVGDEIAVGTDASDNAPRVEAEELPSCNVLEMDCEGAELKILQNMQIHPRVILVESHGVFGSPTEDVKKPLRAKKYEIKREEIAEQRHKNMHIEQDVKVVTARHET